MPLKRTALKLARKLGCLGPLEPEVTEPIPIQHMPEHGEEQDPEPGRPYQDYVESEARQYWQEIAKERNLTKPDLEEIRTAAMPILCRALRNRFGSRRYRASLFHDVKPASAVACVEFNPRRRMQSKNCA